MTIVNVGFSIEGSSICIPSNLSGSFAMLSNGKQASRRRLLLAFAKPQD